MGPAPLRRAEPARIGPPEGARGRGRCAGAPRGAAPATTSKSCARRARGSRNGRGPRCCCRSRASLVPARRADGLGRPRLPRLRTARDLPAGCTRPAPCQARSRGEELEEEVVHDDAVRATSYCGMRPSSTGVASDSKLKKSTMAKVGPRGRRCATLSAASPSLTSRGSRRPLPEHRRVAELLRRGRARTPRSRPPSRARSSRERARVVPAAGARPCGPAHVVEALTTRCRTRILLTCCATSPASASGGGASSALRSCDAVLLQLFDAPRCNSRLMATSAPGARPRRARGRPAASGFRRRAARRGAQRGRGAASSTSRSMVASPSTFSSFRCGSSATTPSCA